MGVVLDKVAAYSQVPEVVRNGYKVVKGYVAEYGDIEAKARREQTKQAAPPAAAAQ